MNYKHVIEYLALTIIVSCRKIPYLVNDTFFVSVLSRTAEKHCLKRQRLKTPLYQVRCFIEASAYLSLKI